MGAKKYGLRSAAIDSEIIVGILVPGIVPDARLVFARGARGGMGVSLSTDVSARGDVDPFATGLSYRSRGVGSGNPSRTVPFQNLSGSAARKGVLFGRSEIHRSRVEFEHRIDDTVPRSGGKRRSGTGSVGRRKTRSKRRLRHEEQREAERHSEREEESPRDDR